VNVLGTFILIQLDQKADKMPRSGIIERRRVVKYVSWRTQVRIEAQRVAVLAATLSGPAAVLALLPRTLNPKLLQQLTEDISARR
jgi:hypothetical protein